MSLRTYLEAAWKDGKASIDPSTLVKLSDPFSILLPISLELESRFFQFFSQVTLVMGYDD